jgi:DNA-binding HxlR family transcriptional regulator
MSVDSDSKPPQGAGDVKTARCDDERARLSVRDLFRRIGDKWSLVVVAELRDGPVRFTTLLARIDGISHRLLATTLRGLERDGLLTRTVFAEVPPRVEYKLTELGQSFLAPLLGVATWAEEHLPEIDLRRHEYDEGHQKSNTQRDAQSQIGSATSRLATSQAPRTY